MPTDVEASVCVLSWVLASVLRGVLVKGHNRTIDYFVLLADATFMLSGGTVSRVVMQG